MRHGDPAFDHEGDEFLVFGGESAVEGKSVRDANHLDEHLVGELLLGTLNNAGQDRLLFVGEQEYPAGLLNNLSGVEGSYERSINERKWDGCEGCTEWASTRQMAGSASTDPGETGG